MEITLYREDEIGREARSLPAEMYNLARHLVAHSPTGVVFVPLRDMQYLAILDQEEFVFVDHLHKSRIDVSWQNFQPRQRSSLGEAVAFDCVLYHADGRDILPRLQGEFFKGLQLVASREHHEGPARVLKFEKKTAG